jgi:localization factor PodJL
MTVGPASLRQAALRGDPAAQMEVAARLAAGQGVERDLPQALHWYGRAAAQGSAVAQYRLGAFYERGLGTARDAERARVWYTRAAEQGNVKAMHNLAVLSVSGGRSDYSAAAKLFAQAADFGLTDSQVNLAVLYQNGFGVSKDLAQAYKWLTLAARGGDREAAGRAAQVRALLRPADVQTVDAGVSAWRARVPDAGANDSTAAALHEPGR